MHLFRQMVRPDKNGEKRNLYHGNKDGGRDYQKKHGMLEMVKIMCLVFSYAL